MKKILLWLMFALLMTGSVMAQDDSLHVDASESLGTISPYVYGANLGHHAAVPPAMMPQAQALGINYVRFGGGDSDQQDLRKSVLDLFVLQVRQMGAEPAVTVRLLGGTPEAAAEMVRYANIQKDYNIRYWSIGNEPNYFVAVIGADSYTIEDLNREWRAIAEAMLEVDPDILLVGPDISQYVDESIGGDRTDELGRDWMREFLSANGDLVDIVSIHRYPYPGNHPNNLATIDGLRATTKEWDTLIPNLRQIILESTGRDIPIAVTELNSDSRSSSGAEASLDSHFNAIWLSDVLGRLIRQQVEIVAYWDMQGVGARTWGLMTRDSLRPTYYVYMMYKHFGTELLASESTDPDVSIYAAKREDGTLTLMVVNLGLDEVTKTLTLDGFTAGGPAEVWRFDTERNAEQIDSLEVADGSAITVPGQSITLYAIPASN